MNIIRIEHVKNTLTTGFSLTVNVDHNLLEKELCVVVLGEEDIAEKISIFKLKGVIIDILIVPKKHRSVFDETEYYKQLKPQLTKEHKITYY